MSSASVTIAVPGIHCDHCKESIEGALGSLGGVESAVVSVPDRTVAVDYDDGVASLEQLRAAIEEQGFDVP